MSLPRIDPATREALLAEVRRHGILAAAARTAGVPYPVAKRWQQEDPTFAEEVKFAREEAADGLEMIARDRAVEGVEKGIYHNGELIATERQYSDTLMTFLLKGEKPSKFGQRLEMSGPDGGPINLKSDGLPLARKLAYVLSMGALAASQVAQDDGSDLV